AAHDVALQKFVTGQQAAHAAHVAVTVPTYLVEDAMQDERAVLVSLQRLEDGLELKTRALLVRPEFIRQRPVWREHDDKPLAALRQRGAHQVWQTGKKGK